MFGRDGAVNPVYDGDHMESEVGLYSQVHATSANDEAWAPAEYDNPDAGVEPAGATNVYNAAPEALAEYDNPDAGVEPASATNVYDTAFATESVYNNGADLEDDEQAGFVSKPVLQHLV
jgi:hypothetical protein